MTHSHPQTPTPLPRYLHPRNPHPLDSHASMDTPRHPHPKTPTSPRHLHLPIHPPRHPHFSMRQPLKPAICILFECILVVKWISAITGQEIVYTLQLTSTPTHSRQIMYESLLWNHILTIMFSGTGIKLGSCPQQNQITDCVALQSFCANDLQCRFNQKCCTNSCLGTSCVDAVQGIDSVPTTKN